MEQKVKPPFSIPTMEEINRVPWNGYSVASTFSGGGGSCTGYRMAGFKVRWANEFIRSAQETYRANHPETILDCRDIKTVKPDEILSAIDMEPGQLDIFDTSPPCQAFSMCNMKNRLQRKAKRYANGIEQVNEDLFFVAAALIHALQPKVFIAENVKGLTVGAAKNILGDYQADMFQQNTILDTLMDCGYRVQYRILDALDYGVPQSRVRIIFVGVRNDLELSPVFPSPLPYRYSVGDACPWLEYCAIGYGMNHRPSATGWRRNEIARLSRPLRTIGAVGDTAGSTTCRVVHDGALRRIDAIELKRLGGFPDDYILTGSNRSQWGVIGNSVPPPLMFHIASTIKTQILDVYAQRHSNLPRSKRPRRNSARARSTAGAH